MITYHPTRRSQSDTHAEKLAVKARNTIVACVVTVSRSVFAIGCKISYRRLVAIAVKGTEERSFPDGRGRQCQ